MILMRVFESKDICPGTRCSYSVTSIDPLLLAAGQVLLVATNMVALEPRSTYRRPPPRTLLLRNLDGGGRQERSPLAMSLGGPATTHGSNVAGISPVSWRPRLRHLAALAGVRGMLGQG
jgi:hypothetical protein